MAEVDENFAVNDMVAFSRVSTPSVGVVRGREGAAYCVDFPFGERTVPGHHLRLFRPAVNAVSTDDQSEGGGSALVPLLLQTDMLVREEVLA